MHKWLNWKHENIQLNDHIVQQLHILHQCDKVFQESTQKNRVWVLAVSLHSGTQRLTPCCSNFILVFGKKKCVQTGLPVSSEISMSCTFKVHCREIICRFLYACNKRQVLAHDVRSDRLHLILILTDTSAIISLKNLSTIHCIFNSFSSPSYVRNI